MIKSELAAFSIIDVGRCWLRNGACFSKKAADVGTKERGWYPDGETSNGFRVFAAHFFPATLNLTVYCDVEKSEK